MYLYHLTGFEHNIVLSHEEKYTQSEFEAICKIAKHDKYNYYELDDLISYLYKVGFKKVKYTAGFFTDGN